jgi:dihydroxyacid dehydratase/phosphogluconate dehydratase
MNLDAPTITGTTWRERLANPHGLAADNIKDNPIILSTPRRDTSGIDILSGNWFESAIVKISGMPDNQINGFNEKIALVLYYENEEEANTSLLNPNLLEVLRDSCVFSADDLFAVYVHNHTPDKAIPDANGKYNSKALFDVMVSEHILKLAVIISGQGPEAFGMPEMFTPMQHINANRELGQLVTLISDGRFSGVSYGAAIGHVTPEAANGGGILYLRTGDMILLSLRKRRIDLLDPVSLRNGRLTPCSGDLAKERSNLGRERSARILERRRLIATSNRLVSVSDAAHGVVPLDIAQEARRPYTDPTLV